MKQPNLDAIVLNDRHLQSLEALDNFLNPDDNNDMLSFPDGIAEILDIMEPIFKAARANLMADSQAALIGEAADAQAKLRRRVKAIQMVREELLDEMQGLQQQIKQGRERIEQQRLAAKRREQIDIARQAIIALGERLGVTITPDTRLKIGRRVGTLYNNPWDREGKIELYTRSTRERTPVTLEELATAKLAPLPQRKAVAVPTAEPDDLPY